MTTSEIPFLDLAAQYQEIRADIDAAVLQVLASGRYILSPEVEAPYRGFGGGPGSLPVAEQAADTVLSLPCFPTLSNTAVERIAGVISAFFSPPKYR